MPSRPVSRLPTGPMPARSPAEAPAEAPAETPAAPPLPPPAGLGRAVLRRLRGMAADGEQAPALAGAVKRLLKE